MPSLRCELLRRNKGTAQSRIHIETFFFAPNAFFRMTTAKPREVFIQGLTLDGKTFRPSDWSERLAGAMSCFRPGGGKGGIGAYIGYSPYCVPRVINGVKCVIVNEQLREMEPMAWDFVMNFARDNQLQVAEACLLPDVPAAKK
jgi:Protein of unknown function (DUF3579)